MRSERINLSGDAATLARELRELVAAPESVAEPVAEIIARVRASGDDALRFYTRELDTRGATPAALNAVIDAVSHLGVRHIDMPANGERVWRAITEAAATPAA